MQLKFYGKNTTKRIILLIFSPLFLLITAYCFNNQSALINSIINQYFKLNFTNVLSLFTADNWFTVLKNTAQRMTIHLVFFLIIEILLIILATIFIFYLLLKIKKETHWLFQEKLIFFGYVFILATLLIIGSTIVYSTYQTFSTIQTDLNKLSQLELDAILHKITLIFNQSTLSFPNIFKDLTQLFEDLKNVLYAFDKVANIPTLIQNWWMHLLTLSRYISISMLLNFSIIMIGHTIQLWCLLDKKNPLNQLTKKKNKLDTDAKITELIEQQKKILQILEKETLEN